MASFVNDTRINVILEDLIREAEEQLVLFCPYFKLHERLRDALRLRKEHDALRLVIVFGKNEDNPKRSMSVEDFEFLKSFPNVEIAYEKRLHAKYYANEKRGVITSLNLHTYSQNNNIEVGVQFKTKNFFKKMASDTFGEIASLVSDTEDLATEAEKFFLGVLANADKVFRREPRYRKTMLGFSKAYDHSEILLDESNRFFEQWQKEEDTVKRTPIGFQTKRVEELPEPVLERGFCIRTGEKIGFNPQKPLSYNSFQSWVQFENMDYRERYCHSCGKSSVTSMRNPLCKDCLQTESSNPGNRKNW